MNEIEKMYKLAEVESIYKWWCKRFDKTLVADCNGIYNAEKECSKCKHGYIKSKMYPPFTAEKQLELIKWISRKEGFRADKSSIEFGIYATGYASNFEIALAKAINCFLEYCSSEEKQQIKEMLE